MLFNRQGLQQKNWRMVKKGKHILFGCSLFFVVGGVSVNGPQVTYASEIKSSELSVKQDNISNKNIAVSTSELKNEKQKESLNNTTLEKNTLSENKEKFILKKEANKEELKNLVDKIKKADTSEKTEKSVKELNLVLSRAEKALDNKEITQEEIDKELKLLKEAFENLEDKPREDKKSEIKEKDDKSNSEKDIKEKQQENNTEDIARRHNEKITKATNIVKEINSLASEINYEFSDLEKEIVNTIEKLPTADNNSEESIQKLLNEAIYLRNRVANRVTRANSGRRDPRNGKVIDKNGESGFRAIEIKPLLIKSNGVNINSNSTNLIAYNSDDFLALMQLTASKGRDDTSRGFYLVNKVTVTSNILTDLQIQVSTNRRGVVTDPKTVRDINIPSVQAAIIGKIGGKGLVKPGTYQFGLTVNDSQYPNRNYQITYNITIKPQSERNTVKDLSITYVDDVRHLTETEKTALIEKFKTEHPDVVNRKDGLNNPQIDFDHAEISADGTTMTIHFKDGFNPKTIQTNATNDVEAKHQSITAYFGDSKELYTNPRQLVRSKTGNEVPSAAQVTYKTPFNLQQTGTRNVVVTTTYENGVTKDVTTPYTVLDFIGKQDKKINQNQSGQLGDARNYITVSDNSALPSELTVRWKGGSSTVDTSAAGVQHKEIEILRGNHLMKTVTIPVEIVDNINPTITAPDNITLTRLEGLPSEINIQVKDNDKGVGLKDGNAVTVENLPAPLTYNAAKSKIEINDVIPNNFQLGKSSIQVTVKAVDKKGNTATKNITFHIQSQTQKYTAVANPQKQEVSYAETPDAGTSIQKIGLPIGTRYTWATKPNTTTGPGDKIGVVTVTYPDGSTDTVSVTVKVRKLSDEHEPTGKTITVNQNEPVTNDRLKAAVTVNNGGTSKVKSVTAAPIKTVNAGSQTIKATVTYLDNTTDSVDIPLEVKDVIAPMIQTPTDRQNWDLIALDRTLPTIKVTSEDNTGGTGIKSTTVTGLPDFLVYDNATKTIKFKNSVQEVTKLPAGQDSKIYNVNIQVTDNSNNSSQRQVTVTVKSMTTKYTATANQQKQTVSYGQTPNAETSINKNGLPEGTSYTWRTMPNTTTGPGQKAGVVIVTYPDGSTDLVDVNVDVRKLSEEHEPTATKIVKNQNDSVSNEDLKTAVTISNNGASKVKSVTPVGTINTVEAGEKEITATVTYLDDTTDTVKIPLEVKDVTPPTIQTPANGQNVDLIALDKAFSPIKVTSNDNAGGSGVQSTSVTDLPDFLTYDDVTRTIKFKEGTQEVPKLPVGTDSQTYTTTIRVTDNVNNSSTSHLTFIVKSMTTKYDATSNTQKQTVSYGETPDAATSVNKTGLPEGTSYAWKTTPVTTDGPGEKDGVVEVTYKDGSKDMVNVKVTVKELSSEYEVTGNEIVVNQNDRVSNDDLKAKVTATSKVGNVNGTDKISKVEPKAEISTANYGDQNITATVTFKDGTTKEVTIPLKVKDVTKPTIQTPADNTNWEMTALDKALPNMEVRAKDNANGSGMKNVTVTGLPDYLEYDSATYTIKFKSGKDTVEKLPENTPSQEFTLNIRAEDNAGNVSERTAKITVFSMSAKKDPTPIPQNTSYGKVPDPNASVDKEGLPEGTNVTWKTPPVVNTPGTTTGEVEITYPDGSKDVVTVNVTVRKVSEDFTATGTQIEVNQNEAVTSNMLKAAVTTVNVQGENGSAKIATVEAKTLINTGAYGEQTIQAKVTYIDGSEQDVTIPLKVKDVTPPTIQTPTNGQNWDLIAVEGGNPTIAVTSEDNAGGSGIKSTTVTGLPDFLEYNEATKMIQFKTGVTSVPKLQEGTDIEPHNVTITVVDNAGNETTTNVTITVKSMTTKYTATPNSEKQTVSYGVTPDAGTSIKKNGLPEGTNYTWTTTPETNTPGEKDGVVEVTYKDGSKDTVNVKVTVKELSSEYGVTGAPIEVNQNTPVTNDDLKAKVTATSTVGNVDGTDKIAKVEPKAQVSTAAYGETNIEATVTFKDGTTKEVTIPLKVKDVTPPTITAPTENTNWEMTALDKTLPNMQ
ncbi:Rib/alpha-like domain-containing protein, partial [Gemella taiwanensis]